MKQHIIDFLILVGLVMIISVVWQILELIFVGNVMPDGVDTIFAILLAFSLRKNLKSCRIQEAKKNEGT